MNNDPATLATAIGIFYKIGWVGFAFVFIFNIGHLIIFLYDIIVGCRKSNRDLMDESRKSFYMTKLAAYE
jgi:hypothetical protein